MSRKLSILQIISKSSISSGGPRQAFQLAGELAERGHGVSFVCKPLVCGVADVHDSKAKLVQLEMRNEFDLHAITALYKLMKKEKTDVVHVHKGLAHSLAYPAARLANVPVFIVNRGVSFPLDIFNRIKYKWKRISKIVAVSEDVKQILIKSGKIAPQKIAVIYGGVDLEIFNRRISPGKIIREFGLKQGQPVIGIIANIRIWKGHKILLQAARQVVKAYPDTVFLIVGRLDNPLGAELKEMSKELGLTRQVIFTGYRKDIPELLSAMDFTVSCSTAGEGLTGTIRESLAMEKPAITSDVGGNRELIIDGKTGLLIPPNQPRALAESIGYLLENPAEIPKMGAAGYALVAEKCTTQARISQMEKLYYENHPAL